MRMVKICGSEIRLAIIIVFVQLLYIDHPLV